MIKFEYKRINPSPTDDELRELGLEGWELVAVVSTFNTEYIFKRPIAASEGVHFGHVPVAEVKTSDENRLMEYVESTWPGQRLRQVKYLKETLHTGLKEAKDIVDKYYERKYPR